MVGGDGRYDEGEGFHVPPGGEFQNDGDFALVHITGRFREHAETLGWREFRGRYAGGDSGGVLGERTQRGVFHLEIADISVTLAGEVENLRVGVEEGEKSAGGLGGERWEKLPGRATRARGVSPERADPTICIRAGRCG